MNCQEARAIFDQPDHPELRSHLLGCTDCARELAGWQQMNRLLAEMPRESAPADLFVSIMKVVEAAPTRKYQPLAGIDWIGSGGLALAAASVAVFFLKQTPPKNVVEALPAYQHHVIDLALGVMQSGGIAQGLIWSVVGLAIAYAIQEGAEVDPVLWRG